MIGVTVISVLATLIAISCGSANAEDDVPMTHIVMLQFNLDGEDPYEFAAYAPEFADTLENILTKGYEFEAVNAIVLGVGKTDCGISVIAVIEYTKNGTDNLSISEIVQYIIDTIDDNKSQFEEVYGVKNVRSVDMESEHVKYIHRNDNTASVMVGAVVGCLCFVGVAALAVVGAAVYIVKKRKTYEKVPLLVDDSLPSERRWLKLPGATKESCATEKF